MVKHSQIDVEPEHLTLIKKILKQHIPYKTIWAYGSRVNWTANQHSDLDLVVFEVSTVKLGELKEDFAESDLPFSVDVMLWEKIPENFRNKIRKKYVVLQQKPEFEGWKESRLGDVADIVMGQSPPSSTYNENNIGLPFYQGVVDFKDRYVEPRVFCSEPKRIAEKGSILLSVRAPVGRVNFTREKCAIGRGNASLNSKNNEQNYLFYMLKYYENDLHSTSSGTVFSSINKTDISGLNIIHPPLSEQKTIASVLSSLDDKIDLLHRQNKTLEAMAETLFRQWFVEEGQEDWEEGKIPDEFDYVMGASPPGESYNEDGEGIAMFQGNADFEFRFPKKRVFTTDPKRFAEKYDTLISVRAPVGEQNMAYEKCCIGRGVAAFRYKRNSLYYSYTYFRLKSLMEEIKQFNETGTVFGSISKGDFEAFEIVVPPIDLVDKFQTEIKPIDDKVITNCIQIRTLEKLRDMLLPKLISGEVRIS